MLAFALGAYRFGRYRKAELPQAKLVPPQGIDVVAIERAVEAATLARDLINTPSNDMGPAELLDRLGGEGVLQVLVEGGPRVAASFHEQELVDRYVLHLAPPLMGAGRPALDGAATDTIADLRRGTIVSTRRLGDDIEIVLEPERTP